MANTIDDYLNLITSEFRDKPKFVDTVTADVSLPVHIQDLLLSMIPLFDIDVAVGDQLDILGKWIGLSRQITVPIPNVYFSWDADYTLGWDYGTWKGDQTPGAVTVLPDDAYRTLLKAKIAANHWDGTIDGAYAVWDEIFTTVTILIQDGQDMTYKIGFFGGIVDTLTLALVVGGYLPLRPEGVRLAGVFTPIDNNPYFAWDVESDFLQGWNEGSWAIESST